jgi:hypothetical protein
MRGWHFMNIKITKEGKDWLDGTFGSKGITTLHIKAEGGKCPQNCGSCRCCKGQIQIVDAPAEANDTTITGDGYTFSVDAPTMQRARIFVLDASGGMPMVTCAHPIW